MFSGAGSRFRGPTPLEICVMGATCVEDCWFCFEGFEGIRSLDLDISYLTVAGTVAQCPFRWGDVW